MCKSYIKNWNFNVLIDQCKWINYIKFFFLIEIDNDDFMFCKYGDQWIREF